MTYDSETDVGRTTSVSALFDSQAEAQRAVEQLEYAGISSERIRLVDGGPDANVEGVSPAERNKGFWKNLGDFFFPDEDRYTYAEGLARGGYLVTVTGLSASQYDVALDILDAEGSVNLDERTEAWRAEGWGDYEASPYAPSAAAASGDSRARPVSDLDAQVGSLDETIPVIEERLRVGKRETSHGRVRVRAYTVEEPINESVDLRAERVEIERRPVDRAVTDADAAFQDRTIEAEEYREEAVIQKEARVVEEVRLTTEVKEREEVVSDTVRRTEVEIEDDRGKEGLTDEERARQRRDI